MDACFQEADFSLILIVVERLKNSVACVQHIPFPGGQGHQGPLDQGGKNADTKYNMVYIHGKRTSAVDCQDSEGDGRGSPDACQRYDVQLIALETEGQHQAIDRQGTGDDGHEQHNEEGCGKRREKFGQAGQQAQDEEQADLHDLGQAVKKEDNVAFPSE